MTDGNVTNKGNKARNITIAGLVAGGIFVGTAWPFFRFTISAGDKKKKEKRKEEPRPKKKVALGLHHTVINHPRHHFEKEYEEVIRWCEAQTMEDLWIQSEDGLQLHGSFLPAENPRRIVILSHGYRGNKFGSMARMARFLHRHGCDLLFIDQRGCGESEGAYITFGAKEQYDLLRWIDLINKRNTDNLPIYLYGQSMGATTILLASGHELPEEVKGIIADSGFSSMKKQLRDIASGWFHFHSVGLLLARVNILCKLLAHFSMKETDTTQALKHNRIPILFFHGEEDTYVLPENTCRNFTRCRAEKEMVFIPKARHLCCAFVAPKLYKEKLREFFRKYDVSPEETSGELQA